MQIEQRANQLIDNFSKMTLTEWRPSDELVKKLHEYLSLFSDERIQPITTINNSLLFVINERLNLNKKIYRFLIDRAAEKEIIFNYHQKIAIEDTLNHPDLNFLNWYLCEIGEHQNLIDVLKEVEDQRNTTFLNLDKYLQQDPKKLLVIESIFSSYIYHCINEEKVHKALNQDCKTKYFKNYWSHLKYFHDSQVSREQGLIILDIDSIIEKTNDYEEILDKVFLLIVEAYKNLTNHCYLAVILENVHPNKWQLISDLTIFSEKFLEHPIDRTYFKWHKVADQTFKYIQNLAVDSCDFQLGNEGFVYRDCYLVYQDEREKCILLFEKNKRDERSIPCPKCRSLQIQGNSYPIIGVRSWECKNIFCGHKSKYNRGKRYSLSSIIRQQAILDNNNIINKKILKQWRRDIVKISSFVEVYEFLISFYSLHGDTVSIYGNSLNSSKNILGRSINYSQLDQSKQDCYIWNDKYKSMNFLKRFLVDKSLKKIPSLYNLSGISELSLYQGDAFEIVSQLESNSLGGVVTSPPYYNAKNYSQWSNIYCYLYDMYNIFKEVYRCLKDGSPLLINIFDYFDNEKVIVFSDMGKKRLILSSYISFICRYIGFKHLGNIAWDKGEIEGNRNFNQGNYSPYYQAPHNCWEHILIFSKENPNFNIQKLPKIIKEKPVTKMIKGKNVYGHTAPFPEKIPALLFPLIADHEIILDPFAGSMTTGITALKHGIQSINIELHKNYCDLALKLLKEQLHNNLQGSLF
ncbi:site-specific DNA-methyltransferase [Crocosphaera sp. UHCC 0190]|uniref:DNA-methyltransferase n=1 Tax=Crocosphaera sp. UHCC 0190 TaxID=3110246 RepID=UPI002B20C407|nr:site-specific DNA-methyltransferase [Crocosphaera sp. UHCC 0190]MEA5508657.1 site-specific DNA-methyltransferase [Crocosphaera sp. UHCC 0190]